MHHYVAIAALLIGVVASPGWAEEKPAPAHSSSYWMQKKLEYSERLLAGLANGDFEEIGQSARSMSVLTRLERWVYAKQPGYREQLKAFHAANERIINAADKQRLEEATEGFNQLTASCVNCHKVVRDARRTQ